LLHGTFRLSFSHLGGVYIIHRIATYLQQLIIYLQRPPRQAAQNWKFSQWQLGSIKNANLEAAKWVIMCFYQHEGHAATLCGARVMEHKFNPNLSLFEKQQAIHL
jgi:hypothetical protein